MNNCRVLAHRAGVRFLLLCLSIAIASSLKCTVYLQFNGSALYQLSRLQPWPGCVVDWAINDIIVANERDVDPSVVIQRKKDHLLLKAYYPNTTYTVTCSKELHKVYCKETIDLAVRTTEAISSEQDDYDDHDDSKMTWIIIPAVVASLGLVIILLVVTWGLEKGWRRKWSQKEGKESGKLSEGAQLTSDEKMI